MRRDFRIPFDFDSAQALLSNEDIIALTIMIDNAIIDFCDLLRSLVDDCGLSRAEICRIWDWDTTQLTKALRPNATRGIPYEVLLRLSYACDCSISNLLYHRETNIPILRKYQLLFNHIRNWTAAEVHAATDRILAEYSMPDAQEQSNEDIRSTISRRLIETADDKGSSPYYLIKSNILRGKLRPTLDVLANEKKYVAKMWQTTLLISIGADLSPDFLMRKDYPNQIKQISLLSGEKYKLRECDKSLWIALLNCPDIRDEHTWIGKLLAQKD